MVTSILVGLSADKNKLTCKKGLRPSLYLFLHAMSSFHKNKLTCKKGLRRYGMHGVYFGHAKIRIN